MFRACAQEQAQLQLVHPSLACSDPSELHLGSVSQAAQQQRGHCLGCPRSLVLSSFPERIVCLGQPSGGHLQSLRGWGGSCVAFKFLLGLDFWRQEAGQGHRCKDNCSPVGPMRRSNDKMTIQLFNPLFHVAQPNSSPAFAHGCIYSASVVAYFQGGSVLCPRMSTEARVALAWRSLLVNASWAIR